MVGELENELGSVDWSCGRLLGSAGAPKPTAWAQNVWFDPIIIEIASIGDAAKKLRAIQRNWAVYCREFARKPPLYSC